MSDAFISCALHEVRRGLAFAMLRAGLNRQPETLTQTAARRLRARLKELSIILRRLIVLIALGLTLAPLKPRGPAKPDGAGEPVLTKSQPPYSCALSGQMQVYALDGPEAERTATTASGPVPVFVLMRRIDALGRILRNPDRYARRVARILERRRKTGEPRPVCLPMEGAHRLHAELGIVSAGLPNLLADAFDRWNNSS